MEIEGKEAFLNPQWEFNVKTLPTYYSFETMVSLNKVDTTEERIFYVRFLSPNGTLLFETDRIHAHQGGLNSFRFTIHHQNIYLDLPGDYTCQVYVDDELVGENSLLVSKFPNEN